jgi:transcriptional regulator with XRE-family HTH domain
MRVEFRPRGRGMDGYDRPDMGLKHPIDVEIRAKLRQAGVNQAEFAKAIGRSQGWLNKYMHGAGNATIDDVVRIAALLVGVDAPAISEMERRLLKAWRVVPLNRQADAVSVMEQVARGYRRAQHPGSVAPADRTPPPTARKARGTRKASGG